MASKQDLSRFIRATFASIWSLELLLFLRSRRDSFWSPGELVSALRGSELLVARSTQALFAAGLVDMRADGAIRYCAATPELDRWIDAVEAAYARSPDWVRRTIVSAAGGGGDLAAFADAFRLRRD